MPLDAHRLPAGKRPGMAAIAAPPLCLRAAAIGTAPPVPGRARRQPPQVIEERLSTLYDGHGLGLPSGVSQPDGSRACLLLWHGSPTHAGTESVVLRCVLGASFPQAGAAPY